MFYLLQTASTEPTTLFDMGTVAIIGVVLVAMATAFYKSLTYMGGTFRDTNKQFLETIDKIEKRNADVQTQDNKQIHTLINETTTFIRESTVAIKELTVAVGEGQKKTDAVAASVQSVVKQELKLSNDKLEELAQTVITISAALVKLKGHYEGQNSGLSRQLKSIEAQLSQVLTEVKKSSSEIAPSSQSPPPSDP